MGAVRTSRKRWITESKWKTLAWWERHQKLKKYIRMQNINNLDIKNTNNRRKMAGLPLIRR